MDGGSMEARNEPLCRDAPDQGEHQEPGVQGGLDDHGLVRSEGSKGECWCSDCDTVCVDRYKLRRGDGLTAPSEVLHLWLILRRAQPKHLVP